MSTIISLAVEQQLRQRFHEPTSRRASTVLHAALSNEASSLPSRSSDENASVGPTLTPESYQTLLEQTERELSRHRNLRTITADNNGQSTSRLRNPLHYKTGGELTGDGPSGCAFTLAAISSVAFRAYVV